jgi:RHS repeat-associated protein
MKKSRIAKFIRIGLLAIGIFGSAFGQSSPDRGYQAANSYAISDLESINMTNGNLMMNIPLASLPGSRGIGATISAHYNSKLWDTRLEKRTDGVCTGENCQAPSCPDISSNPIESEYYQSLLQLSESGGWRIDNGLYVLNIINRANLEPDELCRWNNAVPYSKNSYKWKVEVQLPDGSFKEFRPYGSGYYYQEGVLGGEQPDGYFAIDPNGTHRFSSLTQGGIPCGGGLNGPWISCPAPATVQVSTTGMNYYSTDGSGMRLFLPYSQSLGQNYWGTWSLHIPNGTIVESRPSDDTSISQRITDRNGNKLVWKSVVVNGIGGLKIENEVGQFIFTGNDSNGDTRIIQQGMDNNVLETIVKWKGFWVHRNYRTTLAFNANPTQRFTDVMREFLAIDKIILPNQAGNLDYKFTYNATNVAPTTGNYTPGWGELKSVTIPSGAKAEYKFQLDGNAPFLDSSDILANSVTQKDLHSLKQYDGETQDNIETWQYQILGGNGNVINPDGSVRTEQSLSFQAGWETGLVYRTTNSDGSRVERIWAQNIAPRVAGSYFIAINPYVKTEFTTISNSQGQPTLTAIKDYTYDKNSNLLEVREYDWVSYSSIPRNNGRPTGIPSSAVLKRITSNEYYNPTPVATDTTTDNPNIYANPAASKLKNVIKASEVKDANNVVVSRSEFYYDDPNNKGNLVETKVWDSYKNGTYQAYSNPLTAANSISSTVQYDQYGNPTLSTDAKGTQTQITYGAINGYTGLYPTQVKSAFGTAIEQTSQTEYDFYTGLPKKVTALGNTAAENVVSETEYDVIGRPIKTKAAVGTASEIWSTMEYNDAARRVISRSDIETKGDGKKIAIRHFDQLGRVRLTRSIENVLTEDPYNEADGIKVQTRYETGNPYSYQLSSNPYRTMNEAEMGWTRSKSINTGKHSEVETFAGASLPAPWGTNTSSTGKVQTDIDANVSTVTDQALKQRRTITNALGQLIRVDEPDNSGNLGTVASPIQPTNYTYDTLNNLVQVQQIGTNTQQCGGSTSNCTQTRSFIYTSLSKLKQATNPESGTTNYVYDNNGNLTSKTDARNIVTTYIYDNLNRVTNRNYAAPSPIPENYQVTPNITYTYDNRLNAKGRLTKVTNGISTAEYTSFDIVGRVLNYKQTTDNQDYSTSYAYNLSGALIEETYPSGRVVKNTLDVDGDLQQVQSRKLNGTFQNYANAFTYTSTGAISSLRLGNGKFENTQFNSRLQPIQIGLGSSATSQHLLKLNFDYGGTDNNGNVKSQTITTPTVGTITGFTATQNYTYDSLNRIKQSAEVVTGQPTQGWQQTFIYDRYGNRTFDEANTTTLPKNCGIVPNKVVCAADIPKFNPTTNVGDNKLIGTNYDSVGNTKIDANGQTFVYDAENKQTKVVNSQGIIIGEYFYDSSGQRIKKKANLTNEITIFVYDTSGRIIAEYSTIIASQLEAKVSYLTKDNLGSPRIITDVSGQIISRHDYMPFGEEIVRNNYGADSVRKKFTGYERDTETELDYAQARYYNKKLGRFYSADPENAGANQNKPQSWNAYSYSINNPYRYTDPNGEKYKYCNTENVCVDYGDEEFQGYLRTLPKGFSRVKNENGDGGGVIFENNVIVATYSRPSVDFGSPLADGVMNELHRRAPAMQKFNKIGAAIAGTIIIAPYVAAIAAGESGLAFAFSINRVVAGYRLIGAGRVANGVATLELKGIAGQTLAHGMRYGNGLKTLANTLVNEARTIGLKKVEIIATGIVNPTLVANIKNSAEKIGATVTELGDGVVKIVMNVK